MADVHQPWDALSAPRFTGPRTYARLPHLSSLDGAEAAVFGIPWDGGASFRGGARFGPEAIRSASGHDPHLQPGPEGPGARPASPRSTTGTAPPRRATSSRPSSAAEAFVAEIAKAGRDRGRHGRAIIRSRSPSCVPTRSVHGPLGLVHLDAHTDLWDSYNDLPLSHGTMFKRAIEEGILDPSRVLQAGMRGPLYRGRRRGDSGDPGRRVDPMDRAAGAHARRARREGARTSR